LGKPDPKSIQKSPSLESGLLNMRLDQKVNFIEKVGRWIYVGFETGRVSIYDLTKVINIMRDIIHYYYCYSFKDYFIQFIFIYLFHFFFSSFF